MGLMRFRHLVAGAAVVGTIVAAACGGDAQDPSESAEPVATSATTSVATTSSTAAPASTSGEPASTTAAPAATVAEDPPAESTTTAATAEEPVEEAVTTTVAETTLVTEPAAAPEGPPVPAVTLELDDGTTFVSTEAARPVLYLFWAEW